MERDHFSITNVFDKTRFVSFRIFFSGAVLASTSGEHVRVMYTLPEPHFYIVKLGYTEVYLFLLFLIQNRLWVLVRTASPTNYALSKNKKNVQKILLKIFYFYNFGKISILHGQGLVSTGNVSLAKIFCHRNFGNEFAFTHSKDSLARSPLSQMKLRHRIFNDTRAFFSIYLL